MKNSLMKTKLMAIILSVASILAIVFYPDKLTRANVPVTGVDANPNPTVTTGAAIDVVFVLDTTSSMSGMIDAAKEKIWSIASTMASAEPAPAIRMGIIAFRDRGDSYVTKVIPLTADLDSAYASLMDFKAEGGGDGPESVNKALFDAVNAINWSQNQDTYKTIFLVGDASPHMDYAGEMQYPQILAQAKQKGIIVNSVQCGSDNLAAGAWKQIAQLGYGEYFQVEQNGGAVAVTTPFDEKIAALSRELDDTRLFYGSEETQQQLLAKREATAKVYAGASVAAQARRGIFNSSESGEKNLAGEADLIADIASGKTRLVDIEEDALPESLKSLTPEQQKIELEKTRKQREALTTEIQKLADMRQEYIEKELKKAGPEGSGLDGKIYETIRLQGKTKGLEYPAESAKY